jgi:hypothetical protein
MMKAESSNSRICPRGPTPARASPANPPRAAEAIANRFDRQMPQPNPKRRAADGGQKARPARRKPMQRDDCPERAQRGDRRQRSARARVPEGRDLGDEVGRRIMHRQAKKIANLAREDDHGDARRETRHNRLRDVLDPIPDAHEAGDDEDRPRHHRRQCEPGVAELVYNAIDDDDEGACRPTDLKTGAAERGD